RATVALARLKMVALCPLVPGDDEQEWFAARHRLFRSIANPSLELCRCRVRPDPRAPRAAARRVVPPGRHRTKPRKAAPALAGRVVHDPGVVAHVTTPPRAVLVEEPAVHPRRQRIAK